MNHVPAVNTFSETSALYAVMEKDLVEAHRICSDMSRTERNEFKERLVVLQTIIDDLNTEICLHCKQRITKVAPSQVRGYYPDEGIWYHPGSKSGFCTDGKTAAPVPHSD